MSSPFPPPSPFPPVPDEHTYYRSYDVATITIGVYDCFGNIMPDTVSPIVESITEEQAIELVRIERNHRLVACDWTQLPDVPLTTEEIEEWRVYRQQLRDFPNVLVWNESQWPVAP